MLRSIQRLGLLALLCCATVQAVDPSTTVRAPVGPSTTSQPERPERLRVRIANSTTGEKVYQKSSTLEAIYGDNIVLAVENSGDAAVTVTYALYLNSRCAADGNEIMLGDLTDVEIPVGGASISIKDVATTAADIRCGPGCLFANVTSADGRMGIAREGLLSKCDDLEVDLALTTTFLNAQESYRVTLGEPLLSQPHLDVLADLKVVNHGPDNMPLRSTDLAQSVLAFARVESVDMKAIHDHLTLTCDERDMGYEDGVSPSPDDMNVMKKRSVSKRSTRRQKRDTYYDDSAYGMFEEFNQERDGLRIESADIPKCMNLSLLLIEKDTKLTGGDIIIDEAVDNGGEVPVDLSDVKLEAYKRTLCTWETWIHGSIHSATIIIGVDPLRMNNDPDLCNNAIAINIAYDCNDFYGTEYDQNECAIVSDPVSKNHRAAVFFAHEPMIVFDGDDVGYHESYMCQEPEYYVLLTELNRWKLLTERYQKQSEKNPQLCAEADDNEDSRQREMVVEAEEEAKQRPQQQRKKRNVLPNGGPTGTSGQTGNGGQTGAGGRTRDAGAFREARKANLTKGLEDIIKELDSAKGNKDIAEDMWCAFPGLQLQYNGIISHIPDDDNLHKLFETAEEGLEELDNIHDLISTECEDTEGPSIDFDDLIFEGTDSGDSTKDRAFEDARDLKDRKDDREKTAEDGGLDEKLNFLKEEMGEASNKCPGQRGRSQNAGKSSSSQLLDVIEKSAEAKYSDVEISPLPTETCGNRMLQSVLERGLGKFLNRDLKNFTRQYTDKDREVDEMRYMSHLADVIDENSDNPDMEYDAIKNETDTRMRQTVKDERDRCDGEGEEDTMYKLDDTYAVYWKMKDGKIYQGVPDTGDSQFGRGNGGQKNILWKQMASCSCTHCDNDRIVEPNWGDDWYDDYYGYYGASTEYPEYAYSSRGPPPNNMGKQ